MCVNLAYAAGACLNFVSMFVGHLLIMKSTFFSSSNVITSAHCLHYDIDSSVKLKESPIFKTGYIPSYLSNISNIFPQIHMPSLNPKS